MRALFIDAPGVTRVGTLPEPDPGRGEVLLRVRRVGFCGSDLSTFRGMNPLVSYPRVPGHEIAATIERVGEGVPDRLRPGLDVTVVPYTACGRCAACRRGRSHACEHNQTLGVQRDGAMAPFAVVPWEKVVDAEGLSLSELALVEPLAVGVHAVSRGRVEAGDTVAVIGCGAVGLGAVAGAAARGATVVAVDLDDAKLDVARAAGARHSIDSGTENLHHRLRELTDGHGPDVVVEAVGIPATFRAAVDEAAFAGRVVYIGYAKAPVSYETAQFVKKELDILGSRNATPDDFRTVVELLRSRGFPTDRVVTETVPLARAGEALSGWEAEPGRYTRIHVETQPENGS